MRGLNCSLEILATPFVESPSPTAVSCGGRRCRRRMRGRLQEMYGLATRRPLVGILHIPNLRTREAPLIRLRHLLPQLKSAGGEGSRRVTGCRRFQGECEKCRLNDSSACDELDDQHDHGDDE